MMSHRRLVLSIATILVAACENESMTPDSPDETGIEVQTRITGTPQSGPYVMVNGVRASDLSADGKATLGQLRPGTYTISLIVPPNCTIAGGNPINAEVIDRMLTRISFEVACTRPDEPLAFIKDSVISNRLVSSIVLSTADGSMISAVGSGVSIAWSPGGRSLVYSYTECDYYGTAPCAGGLAILDVETRSSSPLAGGSLGLDPAWSPDGKFIAFTRASRDFGSDGVLTLIKVDDGSIDTIATPEVRAVHPSWSPDGKRLAAQCSFAGDDYAICTVAVDGTGLERLTSKAGWNGAPSWSPDGRSIVFESNRFSGEYDIAIMRADGSGLQRLVKGFNPSWSPDGTSIIFARPDGLFTIGADGSSVRRLTLGRHRGPAWRP